MDIKIQNKLDNFFGQYRSQKYKKGEILVSADEEPTGVFYLKQGVVKMYAISSNGEELIINIYRPISFFPMAWALNGTTTHHYYEAMTDLEVGKASKEEILAFIKSEQEVLFDLMKRVYSGLDGFFMRMEYLMVGSAQARLITELLIYARRFGEQQGKNTLIKLKVTEKDLASQSGIARETVSREIHKLKDKRLISYQKNTLVINDLEKLEEELIA